MSHSVFRRPNAQPADTEFRRPEPDTADLADAPDAAPDTADLGPVVATSPLDLSPDGDLLAEPLDDDLSERVARAAPRRLANRATFVLAALALLAAGFVAGAQVQKSYGQAPASQTSGGVNPAALASAFAGRNGGGGAFPGNGAQGGGGRGITGTVKLVDGTTVYVETADGQTLIVKTSDTTTVSTPGALKDLTAGSTVTVAGQNSNGTVTATSITKTK